jgi:SAM-dependent MidA family methyltransferase
VELSTVIAGRIRADGGWWPFSRYMAAALYEPGLGYYARGRLPFGTWPGAGSDFVTAPELSPLFGAALARQVEQALAAARARDVYEFGAGSGALAEQLLEGLHDDVRYHVVDLSAALAAHQRERLARFGGRVQWHDRLPDTIEGVVVGNEVLDAMPVELIAFDGDTWHERGVDAGLRWADRPTELRPPVAADFVPGTVTELQLQAQGFVRTLAERLARGAMFLVDYGFPEAEYYHPQRHGGTLMCHRAHRSDPDPLEAPGDKDITSHVDFTALALAGQQGGAGVLGYTTQARFLMNCGLLADLERASPAARADALKLVHEHEMGELFKVIGFARGLDGFDPIGFATGDRTHTL